MNRLEIFFPNQINHANSSKKVSKRGSGLKQNHFVTSYLTYKKTKQRKIKGERSSRIKSLH